MADWVTISSLATAGGTLVLAVSTFGSVRSANRAARAAERSLLAGLLPVLIPSHESEREERVMFGEGHHVALRGHGAVIDVADGNIYMAMGVRNAGAGLAVIHGWRAETYEQGMEHVRPDPDSFRRQQLDLFIPAGDDGVWRGAIRDRSDESYELLRRAAQDGTHVMVDLMYGDYEGGQRTIARFGVTVNEEDSARTANVIRYWNLDRDDPR